jgi:uncharacterized LabA/DUF88 family protein
MIGKPPELNNLHLAVLIDADNVPHGCIRGVMEEVAIYGTPTIKRIYGDWTSPNIGGWKGALLEHAITPVQQYGYTTGKNSTDSAMIIDAMDILYSGKTDGFVLLSSDSDFTRLAIRLREAGQKVIGIGERKTPSPFIAACDKFIYIEVIRDHQRNSQGKPAAPAALPEKPQEPIPKGERVVEPQSGNPAPIQLIANSIADIADHDGYAFLGELGNLLIKKQPDFDARNYGFQKLTPLIKSIPRFEIDVRETRDANIKHIYVRDREA